MPIILGPDGPSLGGFVCPFVIIAADSANSARVWVFWRQALERTRAHGVISERTLAEEPERAGFVQDHPEPLLRVHPRGLVVARVRRV